MAFYELPYLVFHDRINCAPLAMQEILKSCSLLRDCIATDMFCNFPGSLVEFREIYWKLWLRSHVGSILCLLFPIELSWWLFAAFKYLLLSLCVCESVLACWQQVPILPVHDLYPNGLHLHLLDSESLSLDAKRDFQENSLVEVAGVNLLKTNQSQPWRYSHY